ncbi:serine/threonine protein kinase [Nonomuraea sp. NPDC050310]|uniref:serine/threonine-protein kinase n=1 Tax=unclassified Nonomuraea TaxID=2593643 RepID=UPI0033C2E849
MTGQGTTLAGRYRLDTRIGAGGMGEVWRGEDTVLARTVAVKVLLPGRMSDPGFAARFQAEARAMATINHPGVVDVYDYGVSGDTVYLVMKFVDGEPLDRLLARLGRIAPEPAMELIAQAASALQAVHDRGIVHRDVKPGNLLVQRDGTLVLTDFGIARQEVASRLTDAGMVLGTAAYCAPEQAEGMPVTPAVDIYALGVVAYECLAGMRPFDGESAVTIALKHIRETPPPLPPDIPAPVRALVERALSKDPAGRFPTAAAMSQAARQVVQEGGARQQITDFIPVTTGASMAPPDVPAGPDNTTVATPQGAAAPGSRRGRRAAAKSRGKSGLVAGVAVVAFLGVGAGAYAITGGAILPTAAPSPTVSSVRATESPSPSRTKTGPKVTKTTRPPTPTILPSTPKETEEPSEEPSETPTTKPPTTKPTPTKSPSPTPSVKMAKIPDIVGKKESVAKELLYKAGFKQINGQNQEKPDFPRECLVVGSVYPDPGTPHPVNKAVEVVLMGDMSCINTPTPTPSPSKS